MISNTKSTILIIDSDINITQELSDRLSSVGFSVISANTPDIANKLFFITSPDIILIDIFMKDTSSIETLSWIKTKAVEANIPIIVLSSEEDVNSKVYSFLSSASDYIVKPFKFAEVLARINTQLKIVSIQNELEKKNKELLERNEILEQQTITDALTGLYNRRYILNKLHSDIAHSMRYKEPISFIMSDIDNFKILNDKYGHLAGDEVLKVVAEIIKDSVREVDITARYGGEEFLIICPNTEKPGAVRVAERIRKRVSGHKFLFKNTDIYTTISLGVHSTAFHVPVNIEEAIAKLIENADRALYKAKNNGRNRIEVYKSRENVAQIKKHKQNAPLETI
jgi:two-component system, cell cycle response regulator